MEYSGVYVGYDGVVEFQPIDVPEVAIKLIKSGWKNSYFEIIEYGDMDDFKCTLLSANEMLKKYDRVELSMFEDTDIPCCCGYCNR